MLFNYLDLVIFPSGHLKIMTNFQKSFFYFKVTNKDRLLIPFAFEYIS